MFRRTPPRPWGSFRLAVLKSAPGYIGVFVIVVGISLLSLVLNPVIGVHAVALLFLLGVVLMALFVQRGPILFAAALSALVWDYFFLPPVFAFRVSHWEDAMLLATYFVTAIILGQFTARLRSQQEAEQAAQVLAESERLSKTLLNCMSHEMRTPIAAIKSATGNLLDFQDVPLSEAQRGMLGEIHEATNRLNRLVGNILDMSRLESGRVKPKLYPCDVREIVQMAIKETKQALSEHRVATNIEGALPLLEIDFVLTQQALISLLMNAAVHTPPGTLVELGASHEAGILTLTVADSGPGIPNQCIAHVFEKFYRGPNAPTGGTGLGLSLVKGFVEAQGGTVQVQNRAAGGVSFTLRFPTKHHVHEETPVPI